MFYLYIFSRPFSKFHEFTSGKKETNLEIRTFDYVTVLPVDGITLYKPYNIHMKKDHFHFIFHVEGQSIQTRNSESIRKAKNRKSQDPQE